MNNTIKNAIKIDKLNHGSVHTHSIESEKDSLATEEAIVKKAKECDFEYIALTNHRNMFNHKKFLTLCEENDVKGILGCEFGFTYNVEELFDTKEDYIQFLSEYGKNENSFSMDIINAHYLALAKNMTGYNNMSKACSESQNNIHKKTAKAEEEPSLNFEIANKYFTDGNIITTSACMAGIINSIFDYNRRTLKAIHKVEAKREGYLNPDSEEYLSEKSKLNNLMNAKNVLKNSEKEAKVKLKTIQKDIKSLEKRIVKSDAMEDVLENSKITSEIETLRKEEKKQEEILKKVEVETPIYIDKIKEQRKVVSSNESSAKKHREYSEEIEEISKNLVSNEMLEVIAKKALIKFQTLVGKENFYVELQHHRIPEELPLMKKSISLAKELNIPIIATNDAHMVNGSEEEIRARQVFTSLRFNTFKELTNGDKELYLKTDDEMIDILSEEYDEDTIIEAFKNLTILGNQCEQIKFEFTEHFPKYCKDGEDSAVLLKEKAYNGIPTHFPNISSFTEEYKERLEYELDVMCSMGYADYHLIVADFLEVGRKLGKLSDRNVEILKEKMAMMSLDEMMNFIETHMTEIGISIGPGRGSAVGSLVCYLLGISSLDPVKYNLLFERFLNRERVSMPDIDSDFSPNIRDIVIEYCKKRYGYDAFCLISTENKLQVKGAIRAAARIYGSEMSLKLADSSINYYKLGDEICKNVPEELNIKFNSQLEETNQTLFEYLVDLYAGNDEAIRIIKDAALIENGIQTRGIHAAGGVITDGKPINEYVPLIKTKEGLMACQCEKEEVEERGLLKMDFLGLNNLKIITDCMRLVK